MRIERDRGSGRESKKIERGRDVEGEGKGRRVRLRLGRYEQVCGS